MNEKRRCYSASFFCLLDSWFLTPYLIQNTCKSVTFGILKIKTMNQNPNYIDIATKWTQAPFDEPTQKAAKELIQIGGDSLEDAFYKNMEFGTGGMRGIMGVGTNRINKYTLGGATQALSDYLISSFPDKEQIAVAIGFDCRINSDVFSKLVADVLSANGIKVYLFESLRPTPELSFAIRHLNCQAGIVLTASHNPKEYNGYKVYWEDGAQLVPPHDNGVIDLANNIKIEEIKFNGNSDLIEVIGKEVDEAFINGVMNQSLTNVGKEDLKIVFTSLHGTSIMGMPQALAKAGFSDVTIVEEQATPDGTFPTVKSPNPEEPEALSMAIEKANTIGADLVIGTDPDADRIGIAVRNNKGEMQIMNGNQTASMMTWYLLREWKKQGKLSGKEFICQTIVTTNLMKDIGDAFGVDTEITLTGFKWIADTIRRNEGIKTYIGGGEESFGYMVGDFVRDKDSISSAIIVSEIAAQAKAHGSSFYQEVLEMYKEFGLYHEGLVSIVKGGKSGSEEIAQMMSNLRSDPPKSLGGFDVIAMDDVESGTSKDLITGTSTPLNLPSSNVLQFYLSNGGKVTARPSGTEPKIKFYFSVKGRLNDVSEYDNELTILLNQIESIKSRFKYLIKHMERSHLLADLKKRTEFCIKQAKRLLKLNENRINERPSNSAWNALQCLDHLNQYGRFYIPEIKMRMDSSKSIHSSKFSSGFIGNTFAKSMLPKVKLTKMQAPKNMEPNNNLTKETINTFIEQQKEYLHLLQIAEQKDLNKIKVNITLSKWIRIKLGDAFRVTIYHNERHILQACKAAKLK